VGAARALRNLTVQAWASTAGLDRNLAMGILVAALDRLVELFGLAERPRAA
jgi:hypothetical protein